MSNVIQADETLAATGTVDVGGALNLAQAAQTLSAAGKITAGAGGEFITAYITGHRAPPPSLTMQRSLSQNWIGQQ
jgi:hypothetical protein